MTNTQNTTPVVKCEGSSQETLRDYVATCAWCGQAVKVTRSGRLFVHTTHTTV